MVAETNEGVAGAGMKDALLRGRHDAVRTDTGRKSAEMVLRIDVDRTVRGEDEGAEVEPRVQPHRRADDERHLMTYRRLDERCQARIILREGQCVGEIQL